MPLRFWRRVIIAIFRRDEYLKYKNALAFEHGNANETKTSVYEKGRLCRHRLLEKKLVVVTREHSFSCMSPLLSSLTSWQLEI